METVIEKLKYFYGLAQDHEPEIRITMYIVAIATTIGLGGFAFFMTKFIVRHGIKTSWWIGSGVMRNAVRAAYYLKPKKITLPTYHTSVVDLPPTAVKDAKPVAKSPPTATKDGKVDQFRNLWLRQKFKLPSDGTIAVKGTPDGYYLLGQDPKSAMHYYMDPYTYVVLVDDENAKTDVADLPPTAVKDNKVAQFHDLERGQKFELPDGSSVAVKSMPAGYYLLGQDPKSAPTTAMYYFIDPNAYVILVDDETPPTHGKPAISVYDTLTATTDSDKPTTLGKLKEGQRFRWHNGPDNLIHIKNEAMTNEFTAAFRVVPVDDEPAQQKPPEIREINTTWYSSTNDNKKYEFVGGTITLPTLPGNIRKPQLPADNVDWSLPPKPEAVDGAIPLADFATAKQLEAQQALIESLTKRLEQTEKDVKAKLENYDDKNLKMLVRHEKMIESLVKRLDTLEQTEKEKAEKIKGGEYLYMELDKIESRWRTEFNQLEATHSERLEKIDGKIVEILVAQKAATPISLFQKHIDDMVAQIAECKSEIAKEQVYSAKLTAFVTTTDNTWIGNRLSECEKLSNNIFQAICNILGDIDKHAKELANHDARLVGQNELICKNKETIDDIRMEFDKLADRLAKHKESIADANEKYVNLKYKIADWSDRLAKLDKSISEIGQAEQPARQAEQSTRQPYIPDSLAPLVMGTVSSVPSVSFPTYAPGTPAAKLKVGDKVPFPEIPVGSVFLDNLKDKFLKTSSSKYQKIQATHKGPEVVMQGLKEPYEIFSLPVENNKTEPAKIKIGDKVPFRDIPVGATFTGDCKSYTFEKLEGEKFKQLSPNLVAAAWTISRSGDEDPYEILSLPIAKTEKTEPAKLKVGDKAPFQTMPVGATFKVANEHSKYIYRKHGGKQYQRISPYSELMYAFSGSEELRESEGIYEIVSLPGENEKVEPTEKVEPPKLRAGDKAPFRDMPVGTVFKVANDNSGSTYRKHEGELYQRISTAFGPVNKHPGSAELYEIVALPPAKVEPTEPTEPAKAARLEPGSEVQFRELPINAKFEFHKYGATFVVCGWGKYKELYPGGEAEKEIGDIHMKVIVA